MKAGGITRSSGILKDPEEEHPRRGYHDHKYDDADFYLAAVAYPRWSRLFSVRDFSLTGMAGGRRVGGMVRGTHR